MAADDSDPVLESAVADVERAAVPGCDVAALDRLSAHVASRRGRLARGELLLVRVVAGERAAAYEWIIQHNATRIAGATVIRFGRRGGTETVTDFVPEV